MAQTAKQTESRRDTVDLAVQNLLSIVQKRRSVRVYKSGRVSDAQLNMILEAARWAPSGANTQPWEFVVTRDRKKMRRIREIYDNEWRQRKREDPVHYKGLKKDYVGDVSVIVLACGDPRTKAVYLTTRQPADREKLFQASMANAVQQIMLAAASMKMIARRCGRAQVRSRSKVAMVLACLASASVRAAVTSLDGTAGHRQDANDFHRQRSARSRLKG